MSTKPLLKAYSANSPVIPAIGAAFAASGVYASYVLIATAPADEGRSYLDIENSSASLIAVVLDDGVSAAGVVPSAAQVAVFSLNAASAAGGQGGSWAANFQGRAQIYAPAANPTAQVAIFSHAGIS